jgi:molybdopterin molybdotransferase
LRLLTGAAIPRGVQGVILEEQYQATGKSVCIGVPASAGANIRLRGEDVPGGSVIIEAPAWSVRLI